MTADVDFGPSDVPDEDDGEDGFSPNIVAIDDRRFENATGQSLAAAVGSQPCGYVLLADARASQEACAAGEV